MKGSTDAFVGRVVDKLREQRSHCEARLLDGACKDFESYKVEVGRLQILGRLEAELIEEYKRFINEDFGDDVDF